MLSAVYICCIYSKAIETIDFIKEANTLITRNSTLTEMSLKVNYTSAPGYNTNLDITWSCCEFKIFYHGIFYQEIRGT